jgi:hypothetical protein
MNAENFIKFVKIFKQYAFTKKNFPELTTDRYPSQYERDRMFKKKTADENFMAHIQKMTENAKIFEVDDDQKRLLLLSDPPKHNDEIKLPFEQIFIDVSFTREELENYGLTLPEDTYEIIGIGISEGNLYDYRSEEEVADALRFSVLIHDDKGYEFSTFSEFYTFYNEDKSVPDVAQNVTPKEIKKLVHKFFLSFLNFLNNPEIELVEHCRSAKNRERREKKGLPIIPSTTSIRVTGRLREYIDEIRHGEGWTYSHRFWVRGHFRTLMSDRYVEKKRIWILPYIKGKGLLIDKTYKMSVKK